MQDNPLAAVGTVFNYGPYEILINMTLAFVLGIIISAVYRYTHKGLSYSQSFTLTIVFVTVVVAVVMMVIGSSLARAFALVGALSIIRFRTVVKDTKDTAYVFFRAGRRNGCRHKQLFPGIKLNDIHQHHCHCTLQAELRLPVQK